MSTYLYRDSQMEQELRGKIDAAANERHGGAVPVDVQERIAAEKQHIFGIEGHSKKPDEAREKIVALMGDVPRVELFARQTAPGWDVWGNEVEPTEGLRDILNCPPSSRQ